MAGFFASGLSRVICQYNFKNSRESVVMVIVYIGGLYYLFSNTTLCLQLAQSLVNVPVLTFFVNNQLGRWVLILGSIRILGILERTTYTASCYFICIYMLRLFTYTATLV
uniref:Uncharacterized protein n=1 Tax=Glaukea argentea TaxID=2894057 RepID=A0A386B1L0_9CHLO|nr:hypothetical protein [Udotea argentea]AYC65594.1 hypothetical protein [Udotea argentea]